MIIYQETHFVHNLWKFVKFSFLIMFPSLIIYEALLSTVYLNMAKKNYNVFFKAI